MTDNGNGNSRDRATVTWRSYAAVMLAVLGFLGMKIYDKVDRTSDTVGLVERSITALNGRMDAQAERLSDHDRRIGRLEGPYFPTTRTP